MAVRLFPRDAVTWDRLCHVCWYKAYALWIEEPQSNCPFGHKVAHECREFAIPSAKNAAAFIKLRGAGLLSSPQKD
jgi:hypothetical protein